MGSASNYVCTECGYIAEKVTTDFDYGFSGDVVTPVVCAVDGIVSGDTGTNAMNVEDGGHSAGKRSFPCLACGAMSPRWDRKTCPKCGHKSMIDDPGSGEMVWD